MNEKVLKHKEICDGLNELYARKNHDYGDSFPYHFRRGRSRYGPYPFGG